MQKFPRILDAAGIGELTEQRSPNTFRVPGAWEDPRYSALDPKRRYTVSKPVEISGRSVFGNRAMTIRYLPRPNGSMRFGADGLFAEADLEHAGNGLRNIVIGSRGSFVGICEHTLAGRHMGLEADVELSGARNFPNHDGGVKIEFEAVQPHLDDVGPAKLTTVRDPVGVHFGGGSYLLLHPDDGRNTLVLDHEFDHRKNTLGTQRVEYEVTPASLAYISAARTICYAWLLRNGLLLSENLGSLHEYFLNLSRRNVLIVGNRLLNPSQAFDADGKNREALMHEVIDKLGAIGLLPGRFVGRVVTRCTSHARDIAALKQISASGYIVPAAPRFPGYGMPDSLPRSA